MKIKELYRRRFPRKPPAPSHLPMLHTAEGQLPYGHSSGPMAFPAPRPGAKQEGDTEHGTPPVHPLHPDVTMKRLPFYHVYDELIKPTTLASSSSQRFEEAHFTFALTPQQVQQILTSRDLLPGAKCDYTIQVQLRFCLCETSCPQEDHFPPNLFVKVNGKLCPLPGYLPPNKSGAEPKRPNRPVNITPLARLSATVPNSLVVNWSSELGRSYSLSVYLVKQLTAVMLLQKLRAKGIRNPDHSRALIKEKLTADPDSEIATTSLRVSLLCPLGKMRLRVPCRATTCSHLQCFDAALYLQMNEKKPTWTCPVCDQKAPYDDLIIDGLFMEILNSCTDCDEIQFMEDGSWCPMKLEKQEMGQTSVLSAIEATPAVVPRPQADVIDLTRDSSDEDEEAPEEAPAAKRQRPLSSSTGHKGVLSIQPRPSSVLRSAPMASLGRDYSSSLPVPDFHPSYSELAGLELFSFLPSENQHYSPSVITSLQEQDALRHLFPYGSTSRPFLGVTPMSMAGSHQTSSIVATSTLQSSPTAQPGCRSDIIALD
ncbi:E3 SUMO-protein ligase PIAS3 [Melopsittacus undulatus]|uniref:E3 SUMO-protein ligase PIAS3 n=1 Tax=Melopsittacus undulatus TaxID=13146 RepID=UPI0003833A72|nr:E3 SUMO-protein ligase PIAS3 [Melopsittacus undulatus]XP_033927004.1 E3 SUMO-protein ligase PIAS3 [Melopsittacus undulatus]